MPKRTDIHSILIIGAGPIIIGQACEFDYSGAQACKALREEGYKVILVNSNPATIMTDPEMADVTYIEPITWQVVAKIIENGAPGCAAADHGRPDGAELCARPRPRRRARPVRRRTDRRLARSHRQGGRPREIQGGDGPDRPRFRPLRCRPQHGRGLPGAVHGRLSDHHPSVLYARGFRRRHRLQHAKSSRPSAGAVSKRRRRASC